MLRILLAAILLMALSSCGFQLRGSGGSALDVERVSVIGTASDLMDEIEDTLKSIGVEVVSDSTAEYSIQILSERRTRRPVATSGNITVSEYEVRLRSVFNVSDALGVLVVPEAELSAQRIYSFDSTNIISAGEEEDLLVEEMRQDLAAQLVRRLSATLRNLPAASAN